MMLQSVVSSEPFQRLVFVLGDDHASFIDDVTAAVKIANIAALQLSSYALRVSC